MKKLLFTALLSLGILFQIRLDANVSEWLEKIDLKKANVGLTLAQVIKLKADAKYKGKTLRYYTDSYTVTVSDEDKKRFAKEKKSPLKICVELSDVLETEWRLPVFTRLSGKASIFIFNNKGELVAGKSDLSLSNLCPI